MDNVAPTGRPRGRSRRRALALVAVLTAVAGLPLVDSVGVSPAEAQARFTDVPEDHPFAEQIGWMVDEEITTGYLDDTFRPGASITRQAMAAFLWRLAGEPTPVGTSSFPDVPTTSPFKAAIDWMVGADITTGYPDGTFRPGASITRQAMAAFLWRFAGELPPAGTSAFTDVGSTHPFKEPIDWLVGAEITTGFPDGTFRPGASITRQATAAFLSRLAGNPAAWDVDAQPLGVDPPDPGDVVDCEDFADYAAALAWFTWFAAWDDPAGLDPDVDEVPCEDLPGAPSVAPPIDESVPYDPGDATRFLYEGDDPIQRDVADGAIHPEQSGTLFAAVRDRDGEPLAGVRVEVVDEPDLGFTLTREDGRWDMVLPSGMAHRIRFTLDDHLPVEREVAPSEGTWEGADDIVMIGLDPVDTEVDADAATWQAAMSSDVTDADGTRSNTLLVPPGTGAELVMPDGSTDPIDTLTVRATEYTVGDSGPEAMPAELPPASGYTYAVEFTVDEALAAGAEHVEFDQPVYDYVLDYLGFPAGTAVPSGWYDRESGEWKPSDNGIVMKILAEPDGVVSLDVTGDGVADTGAALTDLGFTDGELTRLATEFAPGDVLWRVPITHFSPHDYNWPAGCPTACTSPTPGQPGGPPNGPLTEETWEECFGTGSVIGCQRQTLGESVSIAGTPFDLTYGSDRLRAGSPREVVVPVTGATLPDGVKDLIVRVEVAGQVHEVTLEPAPNLVERWLWDGRDGFGRTVNDAVTAQVHITYRYGAVYRTPAQFEQSFALPAAPTSPGGGIPSITSSRATGTISATRSFTVVLAGPGPDTDALGGWSLDAHHRLAIPRAGEVELLRGDGSRRTVPNIGTTTVDHFGGTPHDYTRCVAANPDCGDGAQVAEAEFGNVTALASGPDGSLVIADRCHIYCNAQVLRRVGPDGVIDRIAGVDDITCDLAAPGPGLCGEGGPAIDAPLGQHIVDLHVGPDGTIWVVEQSGITSQWVRRIDTDGTIHRVAATAGTDCVPMPMCLQGRSALELPPYFDQIQVAVHPVTLEPYISVAIPNFYEWGGIFSIDDEGVLHLEYGGASPHDYDDGHPTDVAIVPWDMDFAGDGTLWVSAQGYYRELLWRIDPDGTVTEVLSGASDRTCAPGVTVCDDGIPATSAKVAPTGSGAPSLIDARPDGSVYFKGRRDEHPNYDTLLYRIDPDGTIRRVAGGPASLFPYCPYQNAGECGDSGPASQMDFDGGFIAALDDGRVAYSTYGGLIRIVERAGSGEVLVPDDGNLVHTFDESSGRHLTTRDARTGASLYTFGYDAAGRLTAATDVAGNETTIERAADGKATAIVAPFGQRTQLAVGADGWLDSVTDPEGEITTMGTTATGLLTGFVEPGGHSHTFEYDAAGRLVRDTDPAAGVTQLTRTPLAGGVEVAVTLPDGKVRTHRSERGIDGSTTTRVTVPGGAATTTVSSPAGSTTVTAADGRVVTELSAEDPRWGMALPFVAESKLVTPGLPDMVTTERRTASFDPGNPVVLAGATTTVAVGGRETVTTWDGVARTTTVTSPEGRVDVVTVDAASRVTKSDPAEVVATTWTYDPKGRVQSMTAGTGPTARTMTLTYAASGYPQSITDPAGIVTTYTTDAFGRPLTQTVAGATATMAYDGRGLVASVTPPGAPVSTFVTDGRDLPTSASLSDGTSLAWGYDAARRLTSSGPTGLKATYAYDAAGNLDTAGVPGGTFDATVDSTGRLTSMTSPWGPTLTNTWAGDQWMGTSWAGTPNASMSRTLDDRRMTTGDTVAGDVRSYTYDDEGLVVAAGDATVGRSSTTGLATSVNLGVTERVFTYDPFGAVATDTTDASGAPTIGFDRTYDTLGRLVEVVETVGGDTVTTTYEYDDLGRVTEVSEDGGVVRSYTWDPSGDRLSRVDSDGTASATYSIGGRLLTSDGSTYTHDAAGRLTEIDGPSGDTTLVYNTLGNLRSVTMPDGTVVTYQVDGLGRRVSRSVDGTLDRRYVWDGELRLAAELNAAGGVIARYVYGDHPTLPLYAIRGGQTLAIIGDHVGSPRQLIDTATGDVVGERRYDEFGRVLEDTMGDLLPHGFAAGLGDPDTGLVRFGQRDYDPETGRFTALDPLLYGGGHVNLYLYAAGDPVNVVDRDGRVPSLGDMYNDYQGWYDDYFFPKNYQDYVDKCWPDSIDTRAAQEAAREAAQPAQPAQPAVPAEPVDESNPIEDIADTYIQPIVDDYFSAMDEQTEEAQCAPNCQ